MLTPRKAIKEYCIFCQGGRGDTGRNTAMRLARECHIEACEVWHLRPGQKTRQSGFTPLTQTTHSAEACETMNHTPDISERKKAPLSDGV